MDERRRPKTPLWQQAWVWITLVMLVSGSFLLWVMQPPPPPPPTLEEVEAAVVAELTLPLPDDPSIAVTSFTTVGEPSFDSELADAIARETVAELFREPDMFVIHFDSSKHFRAAAEAADVSRALGVRFILQAELEARGDRLEVAVRFRDGIAGNTLWNETLRIDPAAAPLLPAALAHLARLGMTGELAEISPREIEPQLDDATLDTAAWNAYLLGRMLLAEKTAPANAKAEALFARAVEVAPTFSAAHVELAFSRYYAQQGFESDLTGPVMPTLQNDVRAALEADPNNSRGHELLSRLKMLDYTYLRAGNSERTNREQAMDHLERAVELNPGDPELMNYRSRMHTFARTRSYYAEEYSEEAMRRHPQHDWTYVLHLAQSLQLQMYYERALELLEEVVRQYPDVLRIRRELALVYGLARDIEGGRLHLEAAIEINPEYGIAWETEDATYDHPGNFQRDMEALRRVGLQ